MPALRHSKVPHLTSELVVVLVLTLPSHGLANLWHAKDALSIHSDDIWKDKIFEERTHLSTGKQAVVLNLTLQIHKYMTVDS